MKPLRFTIYISVGVALATLACFGRLPEHDENWLYFASGLWIGGAWQYLKK